MLMGLWWEGGGWWVLVLFWGFYSERLACLGLAGSGVSWGLHHLGGTPPPIDMDSNIKIYVMFVFLFQEIVSKTKA